MLAGNSRIFLSPLFVDDILGLSLRSFIPRICLSKAQIYDKSLKEHAKHELMSFGKVIEASYKETQNTNLETGGSTLWLIKVP